MFLILIAVALFAALSYAVTQSGRGSGNIDKEQQSLKFAEIQHAISLYQSTIQRMVLTGMPIERLDVIDGAPVNTDCTSDECQLFKEAGGDIRPVTVSGETAWIVLMNLGQKTDLPEVTFYLEVDQAMCSYYNTRLGIADDADANSTATGSYDLGPTYFPDTGLTNLKWGALHLVGFEQGCYHNSNVGNYGVGYKVVYPLYER
ncbi:MAG: hypothetical protein OXT65_03505 [Alphaproteobacteria bacterium]|nr:hypothetical protein [Alphaproteobacteria bacterium]